MSQQSLNEYGQLKEVAVRTPANAYVNEGKINDEWQRLRFYSAPKLPEAVVEHQIFVNILKKAGASVIELGSDDSLTLDSIYARDALLVSPKGLIICNMGRAGRNGEPSVNVGELKSLGYEVAGTIQPPGTIEGGDLIWLDETALAVGEGPRTNSEGIMQLSQIVGPDVEVHVVPLPEPSHPDDVFHLMSMISPIDKDLVLIYRPLMPDSFLIWLEARGINFVDVSEDEFIPMGCNVLALGPRSVLMLDRLPETKRRLEAAGCTVQTYEGDEISRKGEGGPTCLTRPLIRS